MTQATLATEARLHAAPELKGSGGTALLGRSVVSLTADSRFMRGSGPPGVLLFGRSGAAQVPLQGSTSLAIPSYLGWEANGSDANGYALARAGELIVGDRYPTAHFRGWFLTANAPTSAVCAFHFWANPPPRLPVSARGTPDAVGELVAAVQTSNTISTGDINYSYVAEDVLPDNKRVMLAGYAQGHIRRATSHNLLKMRWRKHGPLHIVLETNGSTRLKVWVDGTLLLHDSHLDIGAVPPFEAYLEVQARGTAYSVSFTRYAAVCQRNLAIGGLPGGSVVTLGRHSAVADSAGLAAIPLARHSNPVAGQLAIREPDGKVVTFPYHTYWAGDHFTFRAPG